MDIKHGKSARVDLRDSGEPEVAGKYAFYLVGIGASAGGLEALERFFDQMPSESGMAFVVVQHLSPDFKSLMDELLARHTAMPIHRVEHGMSIEPNGVYLIPPKKNMILSYGKLLLSEQDQESGPNLPIDLFFRSLAHDAGDRAIAVVLSGTGSDGSRGVRDVHTAGGLVVVQDTESAGFDGMPRNAVATGVADVISRPETMPEKILEFVQHPAAFERGIDESHEFPEELGEMAVVFHMFQRRYGIDFSNYRATTVQRRLERRIHLSGCQSLPDYLECLRSDAFELDALYRDLLVEVTQFFRDKAAFDRLREEVVPNILEKTGSRDEIRIWVPGCASGEEAYSLAMLFDAALRQLNKQSSLKVFATDVHQQSLETASTGVYTAESVSRIPEELRGRYLRRNGDLFHVSPELRQFVVFAPHDITKDSPFSQVDLISCRNVLIYFAAEVQRRALSLFHFGLKTGGILFLGPSESLGEIAREFEVIDQHWRIFGKLRDVKLHDSRSISTAPALSSVVRYRPQFIAGRPPAVEKNWVIPDTYEALLTKYVPPSLLLNDRYELMHSFGDAAKFLVQPSGRPTMDVLKMVDGDLRMALSAALHRSSRDNTTTIYKGVRWVTEAGTRQVKVVVEPYSKRSQRMFLVCLEPGEVAGPPETVEHDFDVQDQSTERIQELERELDFTKESLQSTVEELELSNEELQSTNEELVASNEELQTTNEELYSVNEELYTVNAEHQRKIEELTQLTADMDNLLSSTEIGTVFLDRELRIRKFTPAISAAFNVLAQDVGRPIEHIAYTLDCPDLMGDVRQVIESGATVEREALGRNGDRYLQQIHPYRTATGSVDGVVITLIDVSGIAAAQLKIQELESANRDLQAFAYAVSHDLRAPLRQIMGNARELHDEGAQPAAHLAQPLAGVTAGARLLETQLECLLTYSRVHTHGNLFETSSLNEIVDQAVANLSDSIAACQGVVTRDRLPVLRLDAAQMVTVFHHLIDNGIKYRADRSPEIHITSEEGDGEVVVSVHDNGIGIQPQHMERIFVIFQRLGFRKDVAGNGLGLALCKRIVERHGGVIWARSEPGFGATFYLRLPTTKSKSKSKSSN